jgi:hypothetical protein
MNDAPAHDDDPDVPLDALLRAHAPAALPDDGFTLRTMQAVRRAHAAGTGAARPAMLTPAEALALENRRHAAQARVWRWSMAGIAAGVLVLLVAMLAARDVGAPPLFQAIAALSSPHPLILLAALAFIGALCVAVKELRSDPW